MAWIFPFQVETRARDEGRAPCQASVCCATRHRGECILPTDLDPTDTEFWDCLFIGGLSPSWGIRDTGELKSRFDWGLDYIRAGYLPPEASLARDVLQEALIESLLKSESHPYHQNGMFDANELLNLDLSPS